MVEIGVAEVVMDRELDSSRLALGTDRFILGLIEYSGKLDTNH